MSKHIKLSQMVIMFGLEVLRIRLVLVLVHLAPYSEIKRPMMNITASIVTDKNGTFTGVKVGDQTISIEQWNENNSGPMSVDEFKKQYKDLYNTLFGN